VVEDICNHVTIEKPVGTASQAPPQGAMCMIKQCGAASTCTDGQEECCPVCHKEAHHTRIVDETIGEMLLAGGAGLPTDLQGVFWKVSEEGVAAPLDAFPDIISFALNTDGCGRNLGKLVDGDLKVNLCGDRTVAWMPLVTALPAATRTVLEWFRTTCACNIRFTNVAGAGTASNPTAYRLAMECGDAELRDDVAAVVRAFNDKLLRMNILDTMTFVPSAFGTVLPDGSQDCGGRDWGCSIWDGVNPRPAVECADACWDDDDATACPNTDCTVVCEDAVADGVNLEGCVICGNPNAPDVKCVDCTAEPFNPRCTFCQANPGEASCAGIERKRVQTGCVGWGIVSGVVPNEVDEATLLQAFDEAGAAKPGCGARELFAEYESVSWTTFTNTKECVLA